MSLKLFGKNAVIYAIGNVTLRASSFLLVPLYTHRLSVEDYGLLATLLITIQFMLVFMSMGMPTALLRFAKEYEDNNQTKYLLGTTTFVNFIAGAMVTCISFLFLLPFFRGILHTDNVHKYLILLCCASLVQSLSAHIMSYYRARDEALKFMIISISAATTLFIANITLLCVFNLGIIGVLSAFITTYTVVFLFVLFDVSSQTGIRISPLLIPKVIRFGFPLVFSMSGQIVIGGASIYFLSYFVGLETVAVYSLGYKLAQLLLITTILPFQLAFEPHVFANLNYPDIRERISRLLTYLALAIAFMSFSILLSLRVLLPLIAPPEYSSAYLVVPLLLPGIAFVGMIYFGETLLNVVQKTYIIGFAMTMCAIISIILNSMLIPVMNWYGAVIALNISYILVGLILSIIALKKFPIPIEWRRLIVASCLFVFSLLLVFALSGTSDLISYGITLTVICASMVFVYFGGWFNNPEKIFIRSIFHRVLSRLTS